MKFRPLHDRVVLRRIEGEEKTKGGIIIPDTVKEKPQEGEVVAVGPGARDEAGKINALDVKAGDRVLFGKWSGTEVKIDGQDLLIVKESASYPRFRAEFPQCSCTMPYRTMNGNKIQLNANSRAIRKFSDAIL